MVTSFTRLCYLVKKLIVGRTGDARCDLLDFYNVFNDCCTMIACVVGIFTMTFEKWCGVLMLLREVLGEKIAVSVAWK